MNKSLLYKGAWALGFTVKEMATGMYKAFEAIRKQTKSSNELFKNLKSKKEK